jgi:hypothetical protein
MRRKRGVSRQQGIRGDGSPYKGEKVLKNLPKNANGRRSLKSLVIQSCFPQTGGRQNQKMSFLSWMGVYRKTGHPYNPLIAEERGAKRRRARKQVAENER